MPVQYRNLVGPTLLQTGLSDRSNSETQLRLAAAFKDFERTTNDFVRPVVAGIGAKVGAAEGAAGTPTIRQGAAAVTTFGAAYNDAALRSYTLKTEADIEDTAARLEMEAGNDPEKFEATMGAVHAEALKTAIPGTEQVINELYTRRFAEGKIRINEALAKEVRADHRATLAEGLSRATDRIGQLRSSLAESDQLLADQEEVKLGLLIDAAEADGTLSGIEAATARKDSMRAVTERTVRAKFSQVLDDPYGNPAGFIMKLKEYNRTSEVLLPEEEDKLVGSLLSDLREHNALASAAQQQQADEARARYDAGEKEATEMLLSGRLSRRTLLEMVRNDELDPTVARTLNNELESGDASGGRSDPQVLFSAKVNLLKYSEQEIATMPGLSWGDRATLIMQRRNESTGWKSTQAAREGEDRIDRALRIPKGMMSGLLDPDTAKQRDLAQTEYYNRVEALPEDQREQAAIQVAEEVADKYIRESARKDAELWRRREAALAAQPPPKEGSAERKAYDADLKRFRAKAAEAEAKVR